MTGDQEIDPDTIPRHSSSGPSCDEGILRLDEHLADAADEAELDEIYETERRLLHVACTRAPEHLLLTGKTPTSEHLADFASIG
jgi:ATP-dependent exoDNAse (exonuclease V) beta subunit